MRSKIKAHKVFEIYEEDRGRRLFTKNILPGKTHFDERIIKENNQEYREFDPRRSKLAAMIMKGCTNAGIRKNDTILYLGVSHGYTSSFVSDMVGEEGLIFGIDPAPRVVRDLVFLSEERKNIIPILANANHPEEYIERVSAADIVYQDISQRNQAEIFIKNCKTFLKNGGYGLLAIKAKSINIKRKPKDIFIEIRKILEKEFTVIDYRILEPFEKDHAMIIIKK
ncbi:MAG: fibrillarin-like rRNA/tRNA 2'-O-methyltransferase [Nanoarchaeota archaeon]|nr:fibrillarin-like rRNA/tRNA 2'-O-methyltransferase [Nanoarchaeota archaeon]MBU1632212.1 fibrillarin-like rRNA/tRNA 2'-O-methyltransferase [Nanoarchaeota archaeon]MBU1876375.1 fibrillarin-like rRNA/tRNA 2'-O-methyltransferase [Nanoarchaeota archaeon]